MSRLSTHTQTKAVSFKTRSASLGDKFFGVNSSDGGKQAPLLHNEERMARQHSSPWRASVPAQPEAYVQVSVRDSLRHGSLPASVPSSRQHQYPRPHTQNEKGEEAEEDDEILRELESVSQRR